MIRERERGERRERGESDNRVDVMYRTVGVGRAQSSEPPNEDVRGDVSVVM